MPADRLHSIYIEYLKTNIKQGHLVMVMVLEIGILGALCILGAWIFETYESVKRHKALVDLRFAAVYALGNVCLMTYSWLINDMLFFSVNLGILAIVLFEIAYTLRMLMRKKGK